MFIRVLGVRVSVNLRALSGVYTAASLFSFRKTFRAGSRTFAPRIDIFNATNESTVTARVTQLGPTYGRVSGIQRARLIKVGLNIEF